MAYTTHSDVVRSLDGRESRRGEFMTEARALLFELWPLLLLLVVLAWALVGFVQQ